MKILILPLAAILFLLGCSRGGNWQTQLSDDESEVQAKGWTYFETLGDPGPSAVDFWMDSSSASSFRVGWVVGGKQKEKKYYQTNFRYYGHSYLKTNGDAFVVVYRREKSQQ